MSPAPAMAVGPASSVPLRIASIKARFEPAIAPAATPDTAASGAEFAQLLSSAGGIGAGTATGAGTGAATGEAIVATAMEYQGVPYQWGGTDPARGLDCSGLVQLVLKRHGIEAPRVSADQAKFGTPIASLADARPGDLIAFGSPRVNHIGIYVGNGQMIHAPRTGDVVRVQPIGNREITAIRRVTGTGEAPGVGGVGGLSGGFPVGGSPAGGSVLPAAISPQVRRFESLFVEAGRRWGIDPSVLAAQAQKESGGNVNAVSPAGALGLMQFMPATAASMGVNPHDPASAINGAARYMSEMLQQFGTIDLALAAYNAGPGAVRRAGNRAPYAETSRYVQQVLELARSPR